MIIITGLGRCGTSILTKYLSKVGFGLGKHVSWNDEMRAGLELSTSFMLNRQMHQAYCVAGKPIDLDFKVRDPYWNMSYREAIQQVDNDPRQGKVDIIKDPRFTWNPELLQAWWECRQDFKLIICHRKIEDIYASRKAMLPHQDDPKRQELPEYKTDFADFITTVLELEIPYKMLYFPNFLFKFDEVFNKLNSFPELQHGYKKGKEIWNDTMELTKYVR